MNRTHRSLLLALLVLVLAAAPTLASLSPAPTPVPFPTVTQAGAGSTISEATDNALQMIRDSHPNCTITSYTTSDPLCSKLPISGDPFCSVVVHAHVLCWRLIPS